MLSQDLRVLKDDLVVLVTELADPSNALLAENEVEHSELICGIVDVKQRLEKIGKVKEGRGKLVNMMLCEESRHASQNEKVKAREPHRLTHHDTR
ncbi:hypothetical protein A0H81_13938 [Grifola frondosa]|uniref:Uncharacterized protein n=1 Tax=Grifola frondosa TaxID=5627 RepID=A0A1C7LMS4_GRIFR|nr:hypothetical protein A0H81_13938 [Grifola frondosa]